MTTSQALFSQFEIQREWVPKWSTCHINIKYFHVTDKMNNGTVQVTCYPTKQMILDFSMQLLQDGPFKIHQIMPQGLWGRSSNSKKQTQR